MNYLEIKESLEAAKRNLMKKMEKPNLSREELESILDSIENYEYIIELTDMNHYERGLIAN